MAPLPPPRAGPRARPRPSPRSYADSPGTITIAASDMPAQQAQWGLTRRVYWMSDADSVATFRRTNTRVHVCSYMCYF
jgi:hypothetical protein